MKILGHHDPTVLERELLARVAEAHARAPQAAPILVVVPTARLGEHVQRRLAESGRAWLGVEVLHFRALAQRILAAAGVAAPRLLSVRLREALLRRVLRDAPANGWARFVARRPGALGPLLGSLDELREAGIGAAAVRAAAAGDARAVDLGEIHAGYEAALERLLPRGFTDDAGLSHLASEHAAPYAGRCRDILVHGVYELVGAQLDLLRALDRERAVTVLLPASFAAPATAYAREFARQWLLAGGGAIEPIVVQDAQGREREPLLAALYDETASPTPATSLRFVFADAQGAASEVRAAVRAALVAVREGCPPHEIALVARDLAVHGPAFEETLEEQGLAWTTSASVPLRRAPVVHDLMVLLEALRDDFPRRPTAEILRSRRIRWDRLAGNREEAPRGDRADRFSRRAGIVGGIDEWTTVLEEWAANSRARDEGSEGDAAMRDERVAEARRIGAALVALRDRLRPERARTYGAHADALESFVDDVLVRRDEPALDALLAILQEMRDLEQVVGEAREVSFREMFAWLDDAVDSASLAPRRRDEGGLRVLDAMQFRGLTCRRLFLLGMNSGRFPRPPRLDPILTDELRGRLAETTRRPLPIKGRGDLEERLLLGIAVGAAQEELRVSWQRADESGRAMTPSLALRELSRISRGRPELTQLIKHDALHVPSHPRAWLESLVSRTGLLTPDEELLLSVLRACAPLAFLDAWYPDLAPGLAMVRATEEFRPDDGAYDARVGPLRAPQSFSVSALKTLGDCPLQFFFGRILRVRALDDEARLFEVDAGDLGSRVHELLERLYRGLAADGLFAEGQQDAARLLALERLRALWPDVLGPLLRSQRRRAPVLFERFEADWMRVLAAFVEQDLDRIHRAGWGAPATELDVERTLDFGRGVRLTVRGRFDRRFETPEGRIVGDYKTGRMEGLGNPTTMLKGQALQVPLYWMLAEPPVTVEVLGIRPGKHDDDEATPTRLEFRGFEGDGSAGPGFLETMRILARLIGEGRFPLHKNDACAWCDYKLACRVGHPPSFEREQTAEDTRLFRDLARKSVRDLPLLEPEPP